MLEDIQVFFETDNAGDDDEGWASSETVSRGPATVPHDKDTPAHEGSREDILSRLAALA